MKVSLAALGAIAIVLVLVAPKLAWVWLLAPIPLIYVAVITQGLAEGPSGPQFFGDYASGSVLASTGAWIWTGLTDRASTMVAVLAAALIAGALAMLAPPYGPARIWSRLGNVLNRYGAALSSLGKESKNFTHPVDPVGCLVALGLGLAMGVLLVVGGTVVELVIVPVGLVVFGSVSALTRLILEKREDKIRLIRPAMGIALATESGVLVAVAIALFRK